MERQPNTDAEEGIGARQFEVVRAPDRDLRAVWLETVHDHAPHVEHAGNLTGDRREELGGLWILGYECGHATQRRLLLGEPSYRLADLGVLNR
ncbi:MAG TPA: hypothetical protein VFU10_01840 [Gaiellaceae bacterium]|nr:hypothetical protein [Gaiellaceae bacterium]